MHNLVLVAVLAIRNFSICIYGKINNSVLARIIITKFDGKVYNPNILIINRHDPVNWTNLDFSSYIVTENKEQRLA